VTITRESLKALPPEKPEHLDVPEWEGDVFIRTMSAREQMDLQNVSQNDMPIRVMLATLVDEQGSRIFTDEDFDLLAGQPFPVIMRVFRACASHNGFSTKELDEAIEGFVQAPDQETTSG
jgi:hypothetical protein